MIVEKFFSYVSILCVSAMAMPQDSTTFFYNSRSLPIQACYFQTFQSIPADGLTTQLITGYDFTLYSDAVNGKLTVAAFNRTGSYFPVPYTRNRGGDSYLEANGSTFDFETQVGCKYKDGHLGFFGDGNYTGGARWLRIAYARSGTSASNVSQPFAVKTSIVPIGRYTWGYADSYGTDVDGKYIPIGEFGIGIRRIIHYNILEATQPGLDKFNPSNSSLRTYYDPEATAEDYYPGLAGYFSEADNAFVLSSGTQMAGESNRAVNRGYILVQYLAAQCNDGTGGFSGTNVGSRTLSVVNYSAPFAVNSSYGGCHGTYGGIHVIENTGDDVWNSADKFRFAHKAGSGNRSLIVRVDQLENTNGWARSGLMIRESNGPGDRYVAVFATSGNGLIFQSRATAGGTTSSPTGGTVPNIKAPIWLKLDLTNGSATASYKTDTGAWTPFGGSLGVGFSSYQYGLAAAGRSSVPNTSVYSNLNF